MKLSRWMPLAFVCSSLVLGALAFVAWIGPAASTVSAAALPQGSGDLLLVRRHAAALVRGRYPWWR